MLITVSAGIVWRDSRFLIDEKTRGPFKNFWEFPGGKIEAGESPLKALVRELREELGITVTKTEFWQSRTHTYPEISVNLHFFHVTGFLGEPHPEEGQRIRWVTIEEALQIPFLEADTAIIHDLAARKDGAPRKTKG